MGVMNLAEIMDRSIEILKKYIKTIIMYQLGYGIIIFAMIFISMIPGVILGVVIYQVSSNNVVSVIGISGMCLVIATLLFAVAVTIRIGIIKITGQEFMEEKVFASDAVKISFKNIIKVWAILTSALVLFIPVGFVLGLFIYFLYSKLNVNTILNNLNTSKIVALIILFILLTLIILGIIIAYITIFAFSLQALIIEKMGVINSLKRSYSLVIDNFWKMYGYTLLFGLIIYAIQYSLDSLLAITISIIFLILKFLNLKQNYLSFFMKEMTYTRWPLTLIVWCIVSPIQTIMMTLTYYNQRFDKEGYDLILKLKEIQKDQGKEQLNEDIEFN